MRDVVRESRMSAGALYLYFKSKDELIEAIAENRHIRERQWITSALQHDNPGAGLQALIRTFAEVLASGEEQQERRLGIQLWAESLLDAKIRASVLAGVDAPVDLLTVFLKREQRQGRFPGSLNCRAAARVLVALYQGLLLQMAWEPGTSLKPQLKIIHAMVLALAPAPHQKTHGC